MALDNVKWLDNAVFYEIYPQSFNDTNGDGIGDFQGIIEKLDYIKELGCTDIWMNPCFESPFLDAGYDVSNYYKAAPRYGTNDDLKRLFDEAHKRGMHILLDLVPGHTAYAHPWFQESMKAEKNEYTDRYVWTDDMFKSSDYEGMACIRGFSARDGACMVNFFSHQPALNYGYYKPDPDKKWQQSMDDEGPRATLEEMKNVMRFWLSMGCDGFRVDMASSLVKGDEDCKGIMRLWHNVRAFLDEEFPSAVMISEWGEPDKSILAGFHMDFVLHFGPSHYLDLFRVEEPYFSSRGKGDIKAFADRYMECYNKANGEGFICVPSGNHDMARIAHLLTPDELKVAFAFLLSLPGVPFIYYGDEIGMRFLNELTSVEGAYYRTGARTPMQWDDTKNAGFSTADADKLYLAMDESADRPTVKAQMADPDSLYHEVKKLIEIRRMNEALESRGTIEFMNVGYPLVYKRTGGDRTVVVIINPSRRIYEIDRIDGTIIHQFGKGIRNEGDKTTVHAQSAVFIEI